MKTIIGKVVILGQMDVGKTSLATRYVEKSYKGAVSPTIGASFFTSFIPLENDNIVKLQIWDTSGQERFKAMAPMFYRNANAALLVYDITNAESFESMKRWVVELKRHVEDHMILCVVGNKIDLEELRQIGRDDAICYARTIGANFYECSAKDNKGIDQVFQSIALGLCSLAGENGTGTLQVYEGNDVANLTKSHNVNGVGQVENVNLSINSVAHGKSVGYKCC